MYNISSIAKYAILEMYIYISKRYGQVVRQWIANPLSPVRIWVPPKTNLNNKIVFRFKSIYIINEINKLEGNVVALVDTTDLKSVA